MMIIKMMLQAYLVLTVAVTLVEASLASRGSWSGRDSARTHATASQRGHTFTTFAKIKLLLFIFLVI